MNLNCPKCGNPMKNTPNMKYGRFSGNEHPLSPTLWFCACGEITFIDTEEKVSELENWNRVCCIRRLDTTFSAEEYVDALDKLILLAKKELFNDTLITELKESIESHREGSREYAKRKFALLILEELEKRQNAKSRI